MNAVAFALPPQLTIEQAASFKAQLLPLLEVTDTVELDGAGVDQIETAGLQLLLALTRGRRQAGRPLRWRAFSEPLLRAAALSGLSGALDLSTEPAPVPRSA